MRNNEGVVEFICEGGSGSEARIIVELRTKFPGLGGTVFTHEGVATALRIEYSPMPKSGHKMFLKHMIIKKLEDYFYRAGEYIFAHIPRPLGSISKVGKEAYEAYLYEWAFGSENFPWEVGDYEGKQIHIRLHDWNIFIEKFYATGIDLSLDCTDPDNGRISKNIIHQYPIFIADGFEMSSLWKRIDFGYGSINIDFEKLSKYLKDNKKKLLNFLRNERYDMLQLAVAYLTKGTKINHKDIGKLETHIGEYRAMSLSHYTSRGSGSAEPSRIYIESGNESLI